MASVMTIRREKRAGAHRLSSLPLNIIIVTTQQHITLTMNIETAVTVSSIGAPSCRVPDFLISQSMMNINGMPTNWPHSISNPEDDSADIGYVHSSYWLTLRIGGRWTWFVCMWCH